MFLGPWRPSFLYVNTHVSFYQKVHHDILRCLQREYLIAGNLYSTYVRLMTQSTYEYTPVQVIISSSYQSGPSCS